MMIFGIALALAVGLVMGLVGAGGSILTVPIMVYVLGVDAVTATAYSLLVVGATSAVGAIGYWRRGLVDRATALWFAAPAVVAVFSVRRFVIPALPETFGTVGPLALTREVAILLLFALIMALSSVAMIRQPPEPPAGDPAAPPARRHPWRPVVEGVVVGSVTGLVGAGGGFAIIPALVVWAGLPMRVAVGTSLTIIAFKSLVGFGGDGANYREFDWVLLAAFTGLASLGVVLGGRLSHRVPAELLRRGFGWFVLGAAGAIVTAELVRGLG
jgi:uncharacterized membrane protein YfcA